MELDVLVVLGSPNSSSGELGMISKNRLDCCLATFKKGQAILLTGGWGSHFNTTSKPHAHYGKKYLIEKGIPALAFLDFALSSNTVDDAVKVKAILNNIEGRPINLSVITSDFHVNRVKVIFDEILSAYEMRVIGAESQLPKEELAQLIEHERKSVERIKQQGLYY